MMDEPNDSGVAPLQANYFAQAAARIPSRYAPIEQIGRGGMAVVVKAVDTRTNETVAIKVLNVDTKKHIRGVRRMRKEMQICRQIDHPNIIRILDGEVTPDRCYLVMEFLGNSQDLRTILKKKGSYDVPEAIHIMAQVGRALAYLHEAGLVHRDIKPANIMVDGSLDTKVMDFGLVKILGRKGSTKTGALVGTPRYLAPEVILGEPATSSVDIYATGLILYELITAKRPFPQDQMRTLLKAIVSADFPPLESVRPDLPACLYEIVARATARLPSQRYPNMELFLVDLRQSIVTGKLDAMPRTDALLATPLPKADSFG